MAGGKCGTDEDLHHGIGSHGLGSRTRRTRWDAARLLHSTTTAEAALITPRNGRIGRDPADLDSGRLAVVATKP